MRQQGWLLPLASMHGALAVGSQRVLQEARQLAVPVRDVLLTLLKGLRMEE